MITHSSIRTESQTEGPGGYSHGVLEELDMSEQTEHACRAYMKGIYSCLCHDLINENFCVTNRGEN